MRYLINGEKLKGETFLELVKLFKDKISKRVKIVERGDELFLITTIKIPEELKEEIRNSKS